MQASLQHPEQEGIVKSSPSICGSSSPLQRGAQQTDLAPKDSKECSEMSQQMFPPAIIQPQLQQRPKLYHQWPGGAWLNVYLFSRYLSYSDTETCQSPQVSKECVQPVAKSSSIVGETRCSPSPVANPSEPAGVETPAPRHPFETQQIDTRPRCDQWSFHTSYQRPTTILNPANALSY